jgi:hypothetical protein
MVCIDARFEFFDTKLKLMKELKNMQKLVVYKDESIQRQQFAIQIETIKMGYVHPNNVNVNIQLKH